MNPRKFTLSHWYKAITALLLATLVVGQSGSQRAIAGAASTPEYDVRFVLDSATNPNELFIRIEMQAIQTTFDLDAANFRFTFNDSALGGPQIHYTAPTLGPTLTGSVAHIVSFNVMGLKTIPLGSWEHIGTLSFNVLNPSSCAFLFTWHEETDFPPTVATGFVSGIHQTVPGNDYISFEPLSGPSPIVGTSGPDVIIGSNGNDLINGKGGNDFICGGGGDDDIRGNAGMDTIYGGAGADMIRGGRDSDTVYGGDEDDLIYGGAADDMLFGEVGDDQLFGNKGDDHLDGGAGNNLLNGGSGVDNCISGTASNCP